MFSALAMSNFINYIIAYITFIKMLFNSLFEHFYLQVMGTLYVYVYIYICIIYVLYVTTSYPILGQVFQFVNERKWDLYTQFEVKWVFVYMEDILWPLCNNLQTTGGLAPEWHWWAIKQTLSHSSHLLQALFISEYNWCVSTPFKSENWKLEV